MRLRARAAKRSKMRPIARMLQSASGYMKNPPLMNSWNTEMSGGGVVVTPAAGWVAAGPLSAGALVVTINSIINTGMRHQRDAALGFMKTPRLLCRHRLEPSPRQLGLGRVF